MPPTSFNLEAATQRRSPVPAYRRQQTSDAKQQHLPVEGAYSGPTSGLSRYQSSRRRRKFLELERHLTLQRTEANNSTDLEALSPTGAFRPFSHASDIPDPQNYDDPFSFDVESNPTPHQSIVQDFSQHTQSTQSFDDHHSHNHHQLHDDALSLSNSLFDESQLDIFQDHQDWDDLFTASAPADLEVLDIFSGDNIQYSSPTTPRRASRRGHMPNTSDIVDLTRDDSPSRDDYISFVNTIADDIDDERRRKRRRQDTSPPSPAPQSKRPDLSTHSNAHTSTSTSSRAPTAVPDVSHIEEIDLVGEEDGAIAATLSRQRAEQITAQQEDENPAPGPKNKLSTLSCPICMDTLTDMTGTVCGHYFCRACLLNWLISNEKDGARRSNCPSCRKPLSRKVRQNGASDVLQLLFKTRR